MQLVGEQQVEAGVHAPNCAVHDGGTWQVPSLQISSGLLQQSASTLQLPLVGAQLLTDSQVPLVSPGRIAQSSPAQQSPGVQVAPAPAQGGAQTVPAQLFEQHSLLKVQVLPLEVHESGTSQV